MTKNCDMRHMLLQDKSSHKDHSNEHATLNEVNIVLISCATEDKSS